MDSITSSQLIGKSIFSALSGHYLLAPLGPLIAAIGTLRVKV
jgi:hypothetical protein